LSEWALRDEQKENKEHFEKIKIQKSFGNKNIMIITQLKSTI
jgi:hypothetical protein